MSSSEDEEKRLRSVALQNAREAAAARRRLEEKLLQTQEQLREQARVLQILNNTGIALASNLKQDAIVQAVTDAATQLTGAQFGVFFHNTINASGDADLLYAVSGAPREAFERCSIPRATTLFRQTLRGECVVRADDISKQCSGQLDPHCGMPPGNLPVRSYLAVAVISRSGEVLGRLFLGHAECGIFNDSHDTIVQAIAAQAAVSIDNARLIEASQKARRDLEQLTQTLERKVIERTDELRKSELLFQQLVAGISDCAVYMLDPDGVITSWNPGAERIKGYSGREIIGRDFSIFYTEEDRAANLPSRVLQIAATAGKFEAEAWRVRKDGSRFWASVLVDPIRNSDGEIVGFAKVTRDMTERRVLQEQLHQSQKMEAIGHLTGGVAHDFNNLLTVILGNLETLSRHNQNSDARTRRALDQATRGAQRAATLTSQLLAFSRRQPLNPKPTDVGRLVSGMSDLIRRTIGEHIAIESVLGAGVWRTEVDAHQLESALLNLAVNARDAMPHGGRLTIETENACIDEKYAAQYAEISAGQYVLISVSDTGVGMTKEIMRRAFDPFFTTKPIGKGTGLGLSQVFGFVKQSGGHITLYSEVGEGTTVKIYLPRCSRSTSDDTHEPEMKSYTGKSEEKILVVEDDSDVRSYSTEILRELGFTVLEAVDGPSGLRMLQHHPEVELLFTDVGLPGMNGRELVERARAVRSGIRVLFTTGYARNAIVHQGRLDPGVELLTKPFTRAQLATRVRAILDTDPSVPAGDRIALIIDDEPLVRVFLADALIDQGFEVVQASCAREGLSAAERLKVDVVFIDIGLPDRSGLELAAELRERSPRLRIVIATGYGQQCAAAFQNDALAAVLSKPIKEDEIVRVLRDLGVGLRASHTS